jgi:hypothetical protein
MKQSTFEVIQEKISTVSSRAVKTFKSAMVTNISEELYRMGFTSSKSVVDEHKKLNQEEVLRARMIRYFGCKVLYQKEIDQLQSKYNLQTHKAERFKDAIPEENQMDIINFVERVKRDELNHGKIETDLYHIPLTTDPFYVTAPPDLFREALNVSEMSKAEYAKWLEDDPIVWKRIWRFNPKADYRGEKNSPTDMYALVTAWGLESILLNNG